MYQICLFLLVVYGFIRFSETLPILQELTENFDTFSPVPNEKLLEEADRWWGKGVEQLENILREENKEKQHVAKNVVIFVGDGMGLSTVTSTRIYKGQREFGKIGEEHNLYYEQFPNVALAKTYTVDYQVPDSAGTATAIFTGIKTRSRLVGLGPNATPDEFDKETYEKSKLTSFMAWAQQAGKHTGIVSTTRITHATPAATYARVSNRDWECDSNIPKNYRNQINDIAKQLVFEEPGKNFKVILGGGQQQMGFVHGHDRNRCSREDKLNLTRIWLEEKGNSSAKFVTNREELENVSEDTEFLLGLFQVGHCSYELMRNKEPTGEPSLTDMVKKALEVLKKGKDGFVLMVEGGLIDKSHHKNHARLAITEAAEMDRAVSLVMNETGADTMILVTADHSHAFLMNGYPKRGNDILGVATSEKGSYPYLTLSYGNGPGFNYHYTPNDITSKSAPWKDPSLDQQLFTLPTYQNLASFYLVNETHGGEDVPVYARGPSSHLIRGVFEQNYIAHFISYAACIGPNAHLNIHCKHSK